MNAESLWFVFMQSNYRVVANYPLPSSYHLTYYKPWWGVSIVFKFFLFPSVKDLVTKFYGRFSVAKLLYKTFNDKASLYYFL